FGSRFRDQLGRVLAFSDDGLSIVSPRNRPSTRGAFELSWWDANSGAQLVDSSQRPGQTEHSGAIAWLAISPDGKTLATASMDHSIRITDVLEKNLLATLHGHMSEVWTLAFSADSSTLVSGAKDGSVSFWAIPYSSKEDLMEGTYWSLGFSKDGRR